MAVSTLSNLISQDLINTWHQQFETNVLYLIEIATDFSTDVKVNDLLILKPIESVKPCTADVFTLLESCEILSIGTIYQTDDVYYTSLGIVETKEHELISRYLNHSAPYLHDGVIRKVYLLNYQDHV